MKRSLIAHCSESITKRSCKFFSTYVIATYIIGLWYVQLNFSLELCFCFMEGWFLCKPVKGYSLLDQMACRNLSTSSVECECHVNFMVVPVIRTPLLDRMSIQLQFTLGNTGPNVLQISPHFYFWFCLSKLNTVEDIALFPFFCVYIFHSVLYCI